MSFNFKKPKLSAASDGAWLEVYGRDGEHYGDWLVTYCDTNGNDFAANRARQLRLLSPSDRQRMNNPVTAEDFALADRINIEFALDHHIRDWRMQDADGKPIKYSREAALAYLTDPDLSFVFPMIDRYMANPVNFAAPDVKKIAGN